MFQFLIGAAVMRWLSRLGESHPTTMPVAEDADSTADRRPQTAGGAPDPTADGTLSALSTQHSALDQPPTPNTQHPTPNTVYPRVQRQAMGSLFEVYLAGTDRDALVNAGEQALDEIERLDRQLSHYRDDSDIARLNMHATEQWVRLEPRLYALLKRCQDLAIQTDGAFDITAGPLVNAWGFYRGDGRVPPDEELSGILEGVGSYRILFDDEDHLVYFTSTTLQIELGAIGKGYAIDEAVSTLGMFNVTNAVLHGGQSTIYALGNGVSDEGWEFTIKDPRDHETVLQTLTLRDEALSTSGNYEQFFEVDGKRYSHIIDPRTGYPAPGVVSVSVVAPTAAESDALSTAFFVMGRAATEEFCSSRPELRVIIVEEAGAGRDEIEVTRIGFETSG